MIISDRLLTVLRDTTRTKYRIQGTLLEALTDEIHRLREHLLDVLPKNWQETPAERAAVEHLVQSMGPERVMARLGQPAHVPTPMTAEAPTPAPVEPIAPEEAAAPVAPDDVAARHALLRALEQAGPQTYRMLVVATGLDRDHVLRVLGMMTATQQVHREPGTGVYLLLPSPVG